MGYYERWWGKSEWGKIPPMVVLDQYRMQEAAFGHAGFLGAAIWPIVPLAWLEHHLLTPVIARTTKATPVEILYELEGKWVDATRAARSDRDPNVWQRVRVRYDNGLTITANQLDQPLAVGALVLDRFGWLAEGAGVSAWTARRDGVIADYAETADRVFANARPASDWDLSGIKRIRPVITHFESVGPREMRFTYGWQVNDVLPRRYSCFVHFGKVGRRNRRSSSSKTMRWPCRPRNGGPAGRSRMDHTASPFRRTLPTAITPGRSACLLRARAGCLSRALRVELAASDWARSR